MSRVLVASTIPAFAMGTPDWSWWLKNWAEIKFNTLQAGHEVEWLAVLQEDGRGRGVFDPLTVEMPNRAICGLDMSLRWFSLDLGVDEWTTGTRLAGIVTGRNLIIDHAIRHGHDWIYFADSDIEAPDDVLPRLLEMDWPVCGAHVPTYCLSGPFARNDWRGRIRDVGERYEDTQVHWNTAGSLLVRRDLFTRVPWRIDPDAGQTDDPATQAEMERLGYPTLVRHDVICRHHPDQVSGFEHRGLDRTVYR